MIGKIEPNLFNTPESNLDDLLLLSENADILECLQAAQARSQTCRDGMSIQCP